MRRDFTVISPFESIPVENGLVVLTGYGLAVRVERGCLILQDGAARNRRQSKFTKATCGIKRLVLLGHTGIISLEAIRWLHDIGAALVQIDADGQLLLSSSPFKETYPNLRRAQAFAHGTPLGLEITRHLIREKLAGQSKLLEEVLFASKAQDIKTLQDDLASVKTLRKIRNIEAKAALIY
jgi:CRISPR/Cas system-associated endonuclease Cas1